MKGGLILKPRTLKDFSYSQTFGAAPMEEIKPLGRWEETEKMNLPVVYQGQENTCVVCSAVWYQQYLEATGTDLSHEFLRDIAHVGFEGASPNQVLDPARKVGICEQRIYDTEPNFVAQELNAANHKTPNHFYVNHRSPQTLYAALKSTPLFIGVRDWNGVVGGHMMIALDVSADGKGVRTKNWWDRNMQGEAFVAWKDIVLAIAYRPLPTGVDKTQARFPFLDVLCDNFRHIYEKYVTN